MRSLGYLSASITRSIPTFKPNYIEFEGEFNTVESYALLWLHLINLQHQADADEPLHVKSTHFAPLDAGDDQRVIQFTDLQKAFLAAGGRITQVFVASDTHQALAPQKLVQEMIAAGGEILYLPLAKVAVLALRVPNFLLLEGVCAFHWVGLVNVSATRIYNPQAPQYKKFEDYWAQLDAIYSQGQPHAKPTA